MKQLEFDFVAEMFGDANECETIHCKDIWRFLLDNPMYNLYLRRDGGDMMHMFYLMDQMSFSQCLDAGNEIYIVNSGDRVISLKSLSDDRIRYMVVK